MARNPLRVDPSRTKTIRTAFARDMRKRFYAVRKHVKELVDEKDVFGLRTGETLAIQQVSVSRQAWRFRTDAQKVTAFRQWLDQQVNAGILQSNAQGRPWMAEYIESAYKKGQLRSYRNVYGDLVDTPDFQSARPFGVSFAGAEETKRLEAMYTRAWNDLQGITSTMSQKLSRHLSLGLAQGDNPGTIARRMTKDITSLTKARAVTIARTEVIAAHAEGQLDGFEAAGVEKVTVMAEWLTAGDNRVCGLCEILEGEVMPISKARGLLPRHPNCRCAWVEVVERKGTKQATALKRKAKKANTAIRKSVQRERPGESFKKAKAASTWTGKEKILKR